jgi:uncharacterized protein with PIN domain
LIVIDSSALVTILRGAPEREQFIDAIVDYGNPRISSATYLEVAMVMELRWGGQAAASSML